MYSAPDYAMSWNLRHLRHRCGEPVLGGLTFNGWSQWMVFQSTPGVAMRDCPRCGERLRWADCDSVPIIPQEWHLAAI
jgi:hypothetical protein